VSASAYEPGVPSFAAPVGRHSYRPREHGARRNTLAVVPMSKRDSRFGLHAHPIRCVGDRSDWPRGGDESDRRGCRVSDSGMVRRRANGRARATGHGQAVLDATRRVLIDLAWTTAHRQISAHSAACPDVRWQAEGRIAARQRGRATTPTANLMRLRVEDDCPGVCPVAGFITPHILSS
jgi:hypothetical protein